MWICLLSHQRSLQKNRRESIETYSGLIQYRVPARNQSKLKSREISFARNALLSNQIILKFYTEHGSDTAVLCAKFENDLTT